MLHLQLPWIYPGWPMVYNFNISLEKCVSYIAVAAIFLFFNVKTFASTPAETFQRAEYLGKIVERLMESDLYEAKLDADPPASPGRPRHVLRLAIHAYENIQFLRSLNGLPEDAPIKTEPKEIKPDDVIAVLDAAIESALGLGDIYRVDLNVEEPALADKKEPGEVLARLRAVNSSLLKLGAPKPLPNDVFRVSLGINAQVKAMTDARGLKVEGKIEQATKASPADALHEAASLIDDLDKLSRSNPAYQLPNGVALPPMPQEGVPVTPANVLLAAQFALADVYSLNVNRGYDKELVLPPVQSGRNPADVKNILAEARLHIAALAQAK